ncbi:MAG TPA: TIGR01777 family oxidoreductase [Lacunisphaera sp.]|nr:TIGR01777 family oxidoreductase [Lacunisphaera sp.]
MAKKAVLAGGSGFLGRTLASRLASKGWEVVILSRDPERILVPAPAAGAIRAVWWNAETAGGWRKELDGATAVVNLAGRSIHCVHTLENSAEILESRLNATQALGRALGMAKQPPAVWVQCSAAGYYGNAEDEVRDESAPPGRGFLAEVCRRWEEAANTVDLPGCRRVTLRLGVVLDRQAGALPVLTRLVRHYLGGPAGTGRQYFSWIHGEDAGSIFQEAIVRDDFTGVYNAAAPEPVRNRELMAELRRKLGRPWCPAAPAWVVRVAARRWLDTEPALVLQGQRLAPARLLAAGFEFKYPQLAAALADLLKTDGA